MCCDIEPLTARIETILLENQGTNNNLKWNRFAHCESAKRLSTTDKSCICNSTGVTVVIFWSLKTCGTPNNGMQTEERTKPWASTGSLYGGWHPIKCSIERHLRVSSNQEVWRTLRLEIHKSLHATVLKLDMHKNALHGMCDEVKDLLVLLAYVIQRHEIIFQHVVMRTTNLKTLGQMIDLIPRWERWGKKCM